MSRRVLLLLRHSILSEAMRLYLSAQRSVELVTAGDGDPKTDLRALKPDVILIEEDGSVDVPAYLGSVPRAKVICVARDGVLTIYRKQEIQVARLDDLLHAIEGNRISDGRSDGQVGNLNKKERPR